MKLYTIITLTFSIIFFVGTSAASALPIVEIKRDPERKRPDPKREFEGTILGPKRTDKEWKRGEGVDTVFNRVYRRDIHVDTYRGLDGAPTVSRDDESVDKLFNFYDPVKKNDA
ncbi:hypothetical protein QCA50_000926 [Cerrena zonata]|uniref:Uncharacterized protein n=1 Tax=Cerrena zonata TaxID=2478898 RepID=A0AAW0GYS8_9APHY